MCSSRVTSRLRYTWVPEHLIDEPEVVLDLFVQIRDNRVGLLLFGEEVGVR